MIHYFSLFDLTPVTFTTVKARSMLLVSSLDSCCIRLLSVLFLLTVADPLIHSEASSNVKLYYSFVLKHISFRGYSQSVPYCADVTEMDRFGVLD